MTYRRVKAETFWAFFQIQYPGVKIKSVFLFGSCREMSRIMQLLHLLKNFLYLPNHNLNQMKKDCTLEGFTMKILQKAQDDLNAEYGDDSFIVTYKKWKKEDGYAYCMTVIGPGFDLGKTLSGNGFDSHDEAETDMLTSALRLLISMRHEYSLRNP